MTTMTAAHQNPNSTTATISARGFDGGLTTCVAVTGPSEELADPLFAAL